MSLSFPALSSSVSNLSLYGMPAAKEPVAAHAEASASHSASAMAVAPSLPCASAMLHPSTKGRKELLEQNFDLKQEILKRAPLPQAVDDYSIVGDIMDWTPTYMREVLEGKRVPKSPLHLQAARYISAMNKSQETREDEIIPFVYVGNFDALRATDPKQGNNPIGYTQIISVTKLDPKQGDEFSKADVPKEILREVILVDDHEAAWVELEKNFDKFFGMIDSARLTKKPILIHCSQGQSRSVSLMLAYLINSCGVSAEDALHFVRTKRLLAEPTPKILKRVEQYAASINAAK